MKLILANNQTDRFAAYYRQLQAESNIPFDYSGYNTLLFMFDPDTAQPLTAVDVVTGKRLQDYDGVYINGYLQAYEVAVTVATTCDALGIGYVNRELHQAPSLSKLSMYAKLIGAGVRVPRTLAGSVTAVLVAEEVIDGWRYPAILKRADADRGIDNFKVENAAAVREILADRERTEIWLLQDFIDNDGFYLVSYYNATPVFSIFRSLGKRPDNNQRKAHMYKPKGGANASLIELTALPASLIDEANRAMEAMNRQIGSVDCIYDQKTGKTYILEVNYNPQLVTIETFQDVRRKALLDNLQYIGKKL
jgi:glutathione synthase/RimK-type ligase-like ATP-grasp enzyme